MSELHLKHETGFDEEGESTLVLNFKFAAYPFPMQLSTDVTAALKHRTLKVDRPMCFLNNNTIVFSDDSIVVWWFGSHNNCLKR